MKKLCKAISALLCVTSLGCCYAASHHHVGTAAPGASVGLVSDQLPNAARDLGLLNEVRIDYPDANPVGLAVSADNTLIVTAKGPAAAKVLPGQIWTAKAGSYSMNLSHIMRPSIRSYGALQGLYYDAEKNRVFACSNSTIKGVSSSVVVFEQQGDTSFRWVGSSSLEDADASCRTVTVNNGTVYAVNEYATGPASGALFSASISDTGELTKTMTPVLRYKDFGYESRLDFPENKRALLSDLKNITLGVEGSGNSMLLSDSYKGQVHVLTSVTSETGEHRLSIRTLDFDEMLSQPTAVLQWSPTELLVSERYGCVYRIRKFEFEGADLQRVAFASDVNFSLSPISAMASGSDVSGTYSGPVLFALETRASQAAPYYFSIKEYAIK